VRAVWRAAHVFGAGDHLSAGIHIVTAVLLVVLMVVLWRRWPASFTAYAIAAAFVGLSARNLDSLERYSLSTVPFVVAAADLTGGGTRERIVLSTPGALLVVGSVLAFSGCCAVTNKRFWQILVVISSSLRRARERCRDARLTVPDQGRREGRRLVPECVRGGRPDLLRANTIAAGHGSPSRSGRSPIRGSPRRPPPTIRRWRSRSSRA
jgi:hypothetical protein